MPDRQIIYTSIGTVPLPDGWTVEEAIAALIEAGHKILRIGEKIRNAG
jgi:hypothetical protein